MKTVLKAGDLVEVKSIDEIFLTLDSNGALDNLPFMPEMIGYCGRQFRVSRKVVQAVIDSAGIFGYSEAYVRAFKNDDVVILEDLRCSGENHDGCKRGCAIFWKEAWLRKADNNGMTDSKYYHHNYFSGQLKTITDKGKYFCQSTQFRQATYELTYLQRMKNLVKSIKVGNYSIIRLLKILSVWFVWKLRRKLFGEYPRGNRKNTPDVKLDLQEGHLVEVKQLSEIIETLDTRGRNRGLHFCPEMRKYCGQKLIVKARADKIISEGTGDMRQIPNTVTLENVFCDSAYFAFGGCPRSDFLYWREVWLKKVSDSNEKSLTNHIRVNKLIPRYSNGHQSV
ncbi:MAG TPA: hypothetical protein VLB50_04590 [Ignavibacteriaceae bacterium]|nr:hypothetical protein [Ignavibacteriaceae bacterium]